MSLSDKFHKILSRDENDPEVQREAAGLVLNAPVTPESTGLAALLYHEGLGVAADPDKCFSMAEKAAEEGDGLGYFLLGYMCDNDEIPDAKEGVTQKKYDSGDAVRFYELCAGTDCRWSEPAHLWLGEHYTDMEGGADPETGLKHYEAIAERNGDAAGALCEYYWGIARNNPGSYGDPDLQGKLLKWTEKAAELCPQHYSYILGCFYAEDIGSEGRQSPLAIKCWKEADKYGDRRAAGAIVRHILEHPDCGSLFNRIMDFVKYKTKAKKYQTKKSSER